MEVFYDVGANKKYLVRRDGIVEVQHNPWFIATRVPRDKDKVLDYEKVDLDFYVFDTSSLRYKKYTGDVYRIEVSSPVDVRVLATRIEKREGRHGLSNIRYVARLSLDVLQEDHGFRIPALVHYELGEMEEVLQKYIESLRWKICAVDIEMLNEGGFPRLGEKVGTAGIYCTDEKGERVFQEVLEGDDVYRVVDVVLKEKPDYVIGWNIKGFDFPYLKAYVNDERIVIGDYSIGFVDGDRIVPGLDLYLFARNYGSSLGLKSHTSRGLVSVARDLRLISRDEEELEFSLDKMNMRREYETRREVFIKYQLLDVELAARIAREWIPVLKVLHLLTGISPYAQQFLSSIGSLSEYALCEYLRLKHNTVLEVRSRVFSFGELKEAPSYYPRFLREQKVISIEGSYKGIIQLDFDMLYPTIAFDQKVDPINVVTDAGFPTPLKHGDRVMIIPVSFNGGMVYEFFSRAYMSRKITKKLKKMDPRYKILDQSVKILANSVYGLFSKGRGSGLNELVSSYIFTYANYVLAKTIDLIGLLGGRVVYGDTDSVFIEIPGVDPEELEEKLNRMVKAVLGEPYNLKLENVYDVLVVYKRKNYVGLTRNGDVVVKGIMRFSMSKVFKDNLEEIIKKILLGESLDQVLVDLISNCSLRDLFVYTSKALDELVENGVRIKTPTHGSSRALILKHLYGTGRLRNGWNTLRLGLEEFTDTVIDCLWVSLDSSTVCLYDGESDGGVELVCGRYEKAVSNGDELLLKIYVFRKKVDRSTLVKLSLATSKSLVNVLYSIAKKRKTYTWL